MDIDPQTIAITAAAWVISIGLHEAGHAFAADALGDPTPSDHGRLTLNPFAHLKPVFTAIVLPLVLMATTGMILGAASTPIDPSRFRKPLRDRLLVAAAGPAVNLLLAGLFVGLYLLMRSRAPAGSVNELFFRIIIRLNLILLMFNMLPFPPLDGGDVLRFFLTPRLREILDGMRQYGILIAIIVLSIPAVAVVFFFPVDFTDFLLFGSPDAR
ncbi:MAG: site-2 protease family protein [Planctomycetes bacterium]|nr:site-2 protease family protein [Planctomycetota bacterium]